MTTKEFIAIFDSEKIFEIDSERRLNGFLFEFATEEYGLTAEQLGGEFIILEGKISLPLIRKLMANNPNPKMQQLTSYALEHPKWQKILSRIYGDKAPKKTSEELQNEIMEEKNKFLKNMKKENREYEIYTSFYHISSKEELLHVIKCIRENRFFNDFTTDHK